MDTRNMGLVVLGYSLLLLAFAGKGYAFGAGNIPSIAQVICLDRGKLQLIRIG